MPADGFSGGEEKTAKALLLKCLEGTPGETAFPTAQTNRLEDGLRARNWSTSGRIKSIVKTPAAKEHVVAVLIVPVGVAGKPE